MNARVAFVTGFACVLAVAAAFVARLLTAFIDVVTNLAFYGRFSAASSSPAGNQLGVWVVGVPVIGALVVGAMARYGSRAIRGHGIPEAMETVLFNQSRIPARLTFLKPLSAAVAIGTGGPFGAEGPIIATGGALGSFLGQLIRITAEERKTLLAAGAASGMAATFGSPVAAVLLAIELLLFEYRPRSVIPVALASVTAAGVRATLVGTEPVFPAGEIAPASLGALGAYVLVGALLGVAAVVVTKAVYAIEDGFARLPMHWMWWPALGAIPVGVIGYLAPRTLGVGYDNISETLCGTLAGKALVVLCVWKLVSWAIALGSGTSGGTLAPLFTVGGGLGAAIAAGIAALCPSLGVEPRVGALVGMASLFAGASRAPLTSVVFAFETTRQPFGLLPLLGGCSAAYLVSCASMRHSIMTEKIARRGRSAPAEYAVDHLEQVLVRDVALRHVACLSTEQTVMEARAWLASATAEADHHGFPLISSEGAAVGVLTRRDVFRAGVNERSKLVDLVQRSMVAISPSASLREAADTMVREHVGRLPVMANGRIVGIVTRSDLLDAHHPRLLSETRIDHPRSLLGSLWPKLEKPSPDHGA